MTTAPPRQGEMSAVPEAQLRAAAEAVLVVADGPVTCAALAEALGVGEARARGLLESLAAEYAGDGDGPARGFVLRRAAGGWRLASAPAFHDLVERFVIGGATSRLSQAALETLAVIAYRQPVTRGRIAAIRGVSVDGVVRTLCARGLIEEAGAEPGGAHRAVVPGQADECAALPRGERDRPEHRRPPRERLAQLAAEDAPPGADDVAVLVARHIHGHAGAGGQGGAGREHRQAAREGEGVDDDEVGGAGPGPVEGRVQPE